VVRVALAVVHGIGSQEPGYADGFLDLIRSRFASRVRRAAGDPGDCLAARVLVLSGILRTPERELLSLTGRRRRLGWRFLRAFAADYLGDAIAYQRTERRDVYRETHALVARELNALDAEAGPGAPLALAAHSLGTIVLSNYIWDIQQGIVPPEVEPLLATPTSRLENLAHLYTMGSPLALWTLRYPAFGRPIRFPSARSPVPDPEWVNFLDDDDIVAYPLRGLSDAYAKTVTRDQFVSACGWLIRWNPLSHIGYWSSKEVTRAIADRLARDWRALNVTTRPPHTRP